MDYRNKSFWGMLKYGAGYWLSSSYLKEAEYKADYFAIKNGMASYLIKTKNFILNHADIPEKYKQKIRRHYMSRDEVLLKVQEVE